MSDTKLKIVAGMPAMNEEKYVGSVVLKARRYVDQVFIVDDGSTDDTAIVAGLAGADVIKHPRNMGYGATIQSIISEAKKRNADILVILDTDSQHNPKEIPDVIKPIIEGRADFVIGSRRQQANKIPFYRRMGQKVILSSVKMLSDEELTDSECGFRAFSRKAMHIMELKETGMAISAEAIAEAARKGITTVQVPVSVEYTKDSSTLNPVQHGLGVMASILSMVSEQRPMFIFGLGGLVCLTLGLAFGIRVLSLFEINKILPIGNTMLAVLFLVVGAFSIFTGLILRVLTKKK